MGSEILAFFILSSVLVVPVSLLLMWRNRHVRERVVVIGFVPLSAFLLAVIVSSHSNPGQMAIYGGFFWFALVIPYSGIAYLFLTRKRRAANSEWSQG